MLVVFGGVGEWVCGGLWVFGVLLLLVVEVGPVVSFESFAAPYLTVFGDGRESGMVARDRGYLPSRWGEEKHACL